MWTLNLLGKKWREFRNVYTSIPTIGFFGERLDLRIRQGATLGSFLAQMLNPNGSPVDLTGCTIRGQIRKTGLANSITAAIECTITDPLDGRYEFGLPDEITTGIPAGESITDDESQYVWDLELEDSIGRVIPLYHGSVNVLREATR